MNPQGIYKYIYISIHALREEGDDVAEGSTVLMDISIHALREEGDDGGRGNAAASTNFYPRPPRGGRLSAEWLIAATARISIHALREEGDFMHRESST